MKALSVPQLTAAVIAGLVAMAVGGYLGLVMPKVREVDRLKAQVRQERVRAGQRPPEAAAPITEDERKLWVALEQRLRAHYPTESELPKAMATVAEVARASGMAPLSLEVLGVPGAASPPGTPATPPPPAGAPPAPPGPPVFQPPPPLATNAATIKLMAGDHRYRDLVRFVDGLATAPVYVAVRSLEVKRTDTKLTTEMQVTSFRWAR